MAYRDELLALEAQRAAITTELDARGTLELARRLASVEGRLTNRRLDVLDSIRIASPCSASWQAMEGEGPVRHCDLCDKSVYDLSGLSAEASVELLSRDGDPACMRLHRRRDGTVITADCPSGRARRNRHGLLLGAGNAVAAAALVVAMSPSFDQPWQSPLPPQRMGTVVMMGDASEFGSEPQGTFDEFDEEVFLHGWPEEPAWPEPRLVSEDE